jgi:hypothetical protein
MERGEIVDIDVAKTEEDLHAPLLIACSCSLAGWAILALWLLQIGAGVGGHGLAALAGLWLSYLCIRRPRIGQPALAATGGSRTTQHRGLRPVDAGWALLLLVVGGVVGILAMRGGTVALIVVTMGLGFAPWSRVAFCRDHFYVASAALLVGTLSAMALGYRSTAPMFLPVACWALWACACTGLCWRITRLAAAERRAKAQPLAATL